MKYRLLQYVRINKPCEHFKKKGTVVSRPSDRSPYYRVVVDGGQVLLCTEDQLMKWKLREFEEFTELAQKEQTEADRQQHEENQWESRTGR